MDIWIEAVQGEVDRHLWNWLKKQKKFWAFMTICVLIIHEKSASLKFYRHVVLWIAYRWRQHLNIFLTFLVRISADWKTYFTIKNLHFDFTNFKYFTYYYKIWIISVFVVTLCSHSIINCDIFEVAKEICALRNCPRHLVFLLIFLHS